MTIRHLRIFAHLCGTLNMTQSAKALNMTQPSISQVVQELEEHYRTRLFERVSHRLVLNAAGRLLLGQAQQILSMLTDTERRLEEASSKKTLRIGASATVGSYLLPRLLGRIRASGVSWQTEILVDNTAHIEERLLASELDMAIVEGETKGRALFSEILCEDRLALVGHPEILPTKCGVKELGTLPFLMREKGSGTAEQSLQSLEYAGVRPKIIGYVNSIDAIHRLVLARAGLAFLPWIAVQKDIQSGKLREIRVRGLRLSRNFRLVRLANWSGELEARPILDVIRKEAANPS
ncbi:MAG TPA: LysR family transcriptional regulator [Fibrobacteraceae bacterium]|nr:LysR family transcriptional regulator [Fibrobacteraceae bacterium]